MTYRLRTGERELRVGHLIVFFFPLLGAGQKRCARPSPTRLSPQLTQCDVALFFFFKWKKLSKQGSGQATFKNYLHENSFEIKLRTTNMNLESPKTHIQMAESLQKQQGCLEILHSSEANTGLGYNSY